MRFEFGILDYIQSHLRNDVLDCIMPLITKLGDGGIVWICLSLLLILCRKTRKTGIAMAVSLVLEALCCNIILKPFVARIRPCDVNTAVQLLVPRPSDYSFPSGHTGASFAAASALFFSKSRLWIPSLLLAILIGFTRLYLYVHYPSDVLAGALVGIMLGWLGNALVKTVERHWHEHRGDAAHPNRLCVSKKS